MTLLAVTSVALLYLVIHLAGTIATEATSIHIKENGSTVAVCLKDCSNSMCVCSDLGSVLNNLNTFAGIVNIVVEYSHVVSEVDVVLTNDVIVSVSGDGNPVLDCNKTTGIDMLSNHSANVSIEFSELEWQNCGKQYLLEPGFRFSGLTLLTFSKCTIFKSSDLVLLNVPLIDVNECFFVDIKYVNSAISISVNPQSGLHSINHTIDSCNFSNHTSSNGLSWGSIGAEYNTSNNTNIYTSIKDCIFEKSMAKNGVAAISTHYRERLNFAKLEIVGCHFSDQHALSEAVIHAHLVDVSMENFLFQLEDNYFNNNSIGSPNGSLVYVSMEEVKSVMEPHFVYTRYIGVGTRGALGARAPPSFYVVNAHNSRVASNAYCSRVVSNKCEIAAETYTVYIFITRWQCLKRQIHHSVRHQKSLRSRPPFWVCSSDRIGLVVTDSHAIQVPIIIKITAAVVLVVKHRPEPNQLQQRPV